MGKYSYATYLLHGPVGTVVKQIYPWNAVPLVGGSVLFRAVVFTLASGALSLMVAWLSWNLLERHALALRHWFRTPRERTELATQGQVAVAQ
jgi:peptidoglycan/LPS O-acetylase OafA/YrhL